MEAPLGSFLEKVPHLQFTLNCELSCDRCRAIGGLEAEKQERLLKQVEEERDFAVKIRDNVSQKFDPWAYFVAFHCHSQGHGRLTTFKQAQVFW